MPRTLIGLVAATLLPLITLAAIVPYPTDFQARMVQTNGTNLYVRSGGHGPQ